MWILSHVTDIKLIIDRSLTLKYCVHVYNTFSFLLQLISLSVVTIKTAQAFHLNKLNDYL